MSEVIDVDLLSKEVKQYLEEWKENIDEEVKEIADKVGKEAVAELKQTSPKRSKKRILQRMEIKKR